MFEIKLVYDDLSQTLYDKLKESKITLEAFHNVYDKKKAWALKNQFAARETPFAVVYYKDKPKKAFYTEDSSCTLDKIYAYMREFIEQNSKKGIIYIEQIKGSSMGRKEHGYTKVFMEGCSLQLANFNTWYRTSPIENIDWENNTFTTKNSTYKFNLQETDGLENN